MSITMNLDSLLQRLYESDKAYYDEMFTLLDKFPTMTDYMQSEVVSHLVCADTWDCVGNGIYTEPEVDYLFRTFREYL